MLWEAMKLIPTTERSTLQKDLTAYNFLLVIRVIVEDDVCLQCFFVATAAVLSDPRILARQQQHACIVLVLANQAAMLSPLLD